MTPDQDPPPTIITASMPLRLWMRSYATPSLVAHVASDKFCDGLRSIAKKTIAKKIASRGSA